MQFSRVNDKGKIETISGHIVITVDRPVIVSIRLENKVTGKDFDKLTPTYMTGIDTLQLDDTGIN